MMGEGAGNAGSRPQLSGRRVVRRHPLAAFYVLSFILSWGYWLAVVAAGGHHSHFPGLLGPGPARSWSRPWWRDARGLQTCGRA